MRATMHSCEGEWAIQIVMARKRDGIFVFNIFFLHKKIIQKLNQIEFRLQKFQMKSYLHSRLRPVCDAKFISFEIPRDSSSFMR